MQTPNSLSHVIARDISTTPSSSHQRNGGNKILPDNQPTRKPTKQPLTRSPPTGINAAMVLAPTWGDNCFLIPRVREVKFTERVITGSMDIINLTFERLNKLFHENG